jgi:hypothetical protein
VRSSSRGFEVSQHCDELFKAVSVFQGLIKNVPRSSEGEFGPYSDMAAVWDAIRKPLSDSGLSVTQPVSHEPESGRNVLITIVGHTSGQFMRAEMPLPAGLDGQELAASAAYLSRIALCRMLSIPSATAAGHPPEDDDGTSTKGIPVTPEQEQNFLAAKKYLARSTSPEKKADAMSKFKSRVDEGKLTQAQYEQLEREYKRNAE